MRNREITTTARTKYVRLVFFSKNKKKALFYRCSRRKNKCAFSLRGAAETSEINEPPLNAMIRFRRSRETRERDSLTSRSRRGAFSPFPVRRSPPRAREDRAARVVAHLRGKWVSIKNPNSPIDDPFRVRTGQRTRPPGSAVDVPTISDRSVGRFRHRPP